jgi:hypothetical protein
LIQALTPRPYLGARASLGWYPVMAQLAGVTGI